MEERSRELQSVWEQRKESLAELEKAKEEMEEEKRKAELGTPEAISKKSQDDPDLFRALAEKLGESFESVGVTSLQLFKLHLYLIHCDPSKHIFII